MFLGNKETFKKTNQCKHPTGNYEEAENMAAILYIQSRDSESPDFNANQTEVAVVPLFED